MPHAGFKCPHHAVQLKRRGSAPIHAAAFDHGKWVKSLNNSNQTVRKKGFLHGSASAKVGHVWGLLRHCGTTCHATAFSGLAAVQQQA